MQEMKRKTLFSLILLSIFANSCGHESDVRSKLKSAIDRKRHTDSQVLVDLKSITPFQWDRFYVFGPYSDRERVGKVLGFDWPVNEKSAIEDRDDIVLLVFIRDNKVVENFDYFYENGDLDQLQRPSGYTPNEAVFEVKLEGRRVPSLELYEASSPATRLTNRWTGARQASFKWAAVAQSICINAPGQLGR